MTAASVSLMIVLGLSLSAAPGALNVETLRRGLRHGFASALAVQLGALLGDAVWLLAVGLGLRLGLQTERAVPVCLIGGGTVLVWTAGQALRTTIRDNPVAAGASGPQGSGASFAGGVTLGAVLALGSPLTVVFWAAVGGLLRTELGRPPHTAELMAVGAAYVLSMLVWAVALSAGSAWGARLVRSHARLIDLTSALLLVVVAVPLIGRGVTLLV